MINNLSLISLSSEVQQVAEPLLQKFNLTYFQFLQVYQDGSFSMLCSHTKWVDFISNYFLSKNEQAVFSHVSNNQPEKLQYQFLWEHNLPSKPIMLAREFNIANGLTFVERYKDHYNMIAVASPVNNHQALDTYLNHLEEIKQFIAYFKNEHRALIQKGFQNRVNLLPGQQDPNLSQMLLNGRTKIPLTWRNRASYLTPKEYACLKELALGKSVKEIAQCFALSPRTVEGYLNRIKNRTECANNRELILLFHTLSL